MLGNEQEQKETGYQNNLGNLTQLNNNGEQSVRQVKLGNISSSNITNIEAVGRGTQYEIHFERWEKEVKKKSDEGQSFWNCPITNCSNNNHKFKRLQDLKTHIRKKHDKTHDYTNVEDNKNEIIVKKKISPSIFLENQFKLCNNMKFKRKQAGKREIRELQETKKVDLIKKIEVAEEILTEINHNEEFKSFMESEILNIEITKLINSFEDNNIVLKNEIENSCKKVREKIISLIKEKEVKSKKEEPMKKYFKSRAEKSTRFKKRELTNILVYRKFIKNRRNNNIYVRRNEQFLENKCTRINKVELRNQNQYQKIKSCNRIIREIREEISNTEQRIEFKNYKKKLLKIFYKNRTQCFKMLMERKIIKNKRCKIDKEKLESFFKNEAVGTKSLDIIYETPCFIKELKERKLLPRRCTNEEYKGKQFTMKELEYQIKKSKSNSTPGFDSISNLIIKKLVNIHKWLLLIFETCRVTPTCIPSEWKSGHVKLLYKKGNGDDPGNWRPICLLTNIYKLFSAMISSRIHLHHKKLTKNKEQGIFSNCQRGFKPKIDGTMINTNILKAIFEKISYEKDNKKTGVTWIDFRNAFGSADHKVVFDFCKILNVPKYIRNIIENIYTGSFFQVEYEKNLWSDPITLEKGVKQGCCLSPTIFNMFLEPLLRWLKIGNAGVKINNNDKINILGYCDDIATVTEGLGETQILFNKIKAFGQAVGIDLKATKCATMLVSKRNKKKIEIENPQLQYEGEQVPVLNINDSYRFLGVELDTKLTYMNIRKNINSFLKKALLRLHESPLKGRQKIALLKQCVIPKLSFPLHAANLPITFIRKQDKTIRKYLRTWLGLNKGAATDFFHISPKLGGLNIPALEDEAIRRMTSSKVRTLLGTDIEAKNAAIYTINQERKKIVRYLKNFNPTLDKYSTNIVEELEKEIKLENIDKVNSVTWNKTIKILENFPGKICNKIKYKGWSKIFNIFKEISWELVENKIIENKEEKKEIKLDNIQKNMMERLQMKRKENMMKKIKHGARMKAGINPNSNGRDLEIGNTLSQSNDWLRKTFLLSEQEFKWAIKVKLDILPCKVNLKKWNLVQSKRCKKCKRRNETTHHILNGCKWRLNKNLYTVRHNAIQNLIVEEIKIAQEEVEKISNIKNIDYIVLVDKEPLPEYKITNLRPDLQIIKKSSNPYRKSSNSILDVKCPDILSREYKNIHRRNVEKYSDLLRNDEKWTSTLETIIVTSNGVVPQCSLYALKSLNFETRKALKILSKLSILAIKQSFKVLKNTM